MNLGKLAIIPMDQIDFGSRKRKEYGDINELIESIKKHGLIHPIAVYSETGSPPYLLAAGGRRYLAFLAMEEPNISCRIYDHPLSEHELKAIELLENLDRKDFTFKEKCDLHRDIHNLMVAVHGEKVSTSPDAKGWSLRDTANFLGKSVGLISEDIKLAETMETFPELELDKCKGKKEAMKSAARFEQVLVRTELAKRAEKQLGDVNRTLADSYVVGDFFDEVVKIPDGTIDLVEIDPPYAISLQRAKKFEGTSYKATYGNTYNEVDADFYGSFMSGVLKEAYRVMNEGSWLIMWFAPEPWFEPMFKWITDAGFKCRRMPALWTKGNHTGQTMQPSIYLGASYEMFYYCRKGGAKILTQGRKSQFDFDPVFPANKIHPTERPVELLEEILRTFVMEGSRVLVPFAGSGNTLIAAANCKMIPLGYDLEKEYKDGFVARLLGGQQ